MSITDVYSIFCEPITAGAEAAQAVPERGAGSAPRTDANDGSGAASGNRGRRTTRHHAAAVNVLRILRGGGTDGVPTLEVAERMVEQTPGITRLLDRLEAKGFVKRQRCPKDRRQHLCWITPKSAALLEKLDGPMVQFGEQLMKGLKPEDRNTLIRLLDALRAAHE